MLPSNLISRLKIAENNFTQEKKRFYSPYCVITGIEFIKFIIKYNNYELTKFRNRKLGFDENIFKIPIDKNKLKESIDNMINSSFKDIDYKNKLISYVNKAHNRVDEREL